ncbi:MAG: hypothetical protein GPJ52_01815 [Candidatus Heimdallarchaeota archaeon]|nr:hypothetical protein [Candidatus Heimdallarchaeota archaeon]
MIKTIKKHTLYNDMTEIPIVKKDYKLNLIGNQTSSIHILLLLEEFGDLYFTQLYKYGVNQSTLGRAKKILLDLKLIEKYLVRKHKTERTYYKLTEKGMLVAKKLREIEEIV